MYIGSWALALQSLSVLPLLFESEPLHPLIGYDLICGKPWMIGLHIYFLQSEFSPSNEPGMPWPVISTNSNSSSSSATSPHNIPNDTPANIIPSYHYLCITSTHANLVLPARLTNMYTLQTEVPLLAPYDWPATHPNS